MSASLVGCIVGGCTHESVDHHSTSLCFQLWAANLNFWEDLQDYHMTFQCSILEPFIVIKKAKVRTDSQAVTSAS